MHTVHKYGGQRTTNHGSWSSGTFYLLFEAKSLIGLRLPHIGKHQSLAGLGVSRDPPISTTPFPISEMTYMPCHAKPFSWVLELLRQALD